ncbi:hypothetical protein PDESU_02823 [Pontiella desulfatans]|uniref:Uncharacterized protein n=1 Tax=Pontiella desulfatans TaxID=2750659 RepID=A0A6C2U3T2_PONDE|nr:prepilin-type N-terminal cleavage/methylation domain-containing protein [Pontiella desulfatans]VGO14264.1 hypothetical protein PDESU_02823 [Pontiella desulfatans]
MRRAGFTLPETVVAMSLFAAAAAALCQAAINARHGLLRLERKDAAHLRIEWLRDDILSITDRATLEEGGEMVFPQHIRKNPKEDEEGDGDAKDDVRAQWEVEIFPTPLLDVHQLVITLSVEQGEEMKEPQVASYYVYRPGWYEEEDGRGSLMTDKQDAWDREQMGKGL